MALHLVKIACTRPDEYGRSLATWDCRELARQVVADGVVESISADTVGRILNNHRLKPWRHHLWLAPKVPRDAAFAAQVQEICDLYTRERGTHAVVLCADEKTSRQPRTRKAHDAASRAGAAGAGGTRVPTHRGAEPVRGLRHTLREGLVQDQATFFSIF